MTTTLEQVTAHVAEKIEPGAILYSSWGYDQTNIDYYMVTRCTAKSAWIVPMKAHEEPSGFMCGHSTPLEPMTHTSFCECGHSVYRHQHVLNMSGPDYHVCSEGVCACRDPRPQVIVPKVHRIRRFTSSESLSLTSYSSAYLWEGRAHYASHYA